MVTRKRFVALVSALALVVVAPASAELVDFTGLDASGGTFTTGIGGGEIIGVTVGPIGNVGAAGSFLEATYAGAGLRQVTQNAGGSYDMGDQSSVTVTLDSPDAFTISTGSGISAADGRDIIRIAPAGVPSGGADFWVVSGTSNVNVSEDTNHVLTLEGTGADGVFMTYVVQPGSPISSFTVTHESTVSGTSVNSQIFDLDVSATSVIDVPTLGPAGLAVLAGALLCFGALVLRRRF